MRKPQLVFWSRTISLSPAAVDQKGHISVSCEQAARAIGLATLVVLFLLVKIKHFLKGLQVESFWTNQNQTLPGLYQHKKSKVSTSGGIWSLWLK